MDRVLVAGNQWNKLDPRIRRLIMIGGVLEGLLKIAALIDLVRRPSADVRGSKVRWAAAITFINSVGAVPILYFFKGRRNSHPAR